MISRHLIALVLAAWLGGLLSSQAQPAQIILIRHAEKTDDPDDIHLSETGKKRALALTSYFTEKREFLTNGLPAALFAAGTRKEDHSTRPQETLEPLSKKLGLPVQTMFQAKQYEVLAHYLLTHPALKGKTVLVCWVREYIPELLGALGYKGEVKKWKPNNYERVYLLTYTNRSVSLKEFTHKMK